MSQPCVCNLSNSIDTITSISIGKVVRYIVFYRFALLKEMIQEHAENAGRERTPDFAETFYMVQLLWLLADGVKRYGREEARTFQTDFFEELSKVVDILVNCYQHDNSLRVYRFLSTVMQDPQKWTNDSICLKQSQTIQELYPMGDFLLRTLNLRNCHLRTSNLRKVRKVGLLYTIVVK